MKKKKNNNSSKKHRAKGGGQDQDQEQEQERRKRLEIVKAVAQAWLSHSTNTARASCSEFEARTRYSFVRDKPSRFKTEASSSAAMNRTDYSYPSASRWDFGQSLWDSYEIVAVSKRLERGLALENAFSGFVGDDDDEGWSRLIRLKKKKKKKQEAEEEEKRNSLKSLFYRACSRRYNNLDVNIPEN